MQYKKVRLIGIPMDLGQSLRGVDMGPSAIRYAGLTQRLRRLGFIVEDQGNIEVAVRGSLREEAQGLEMLPEVAKVCAAIYERAKEAVAEGYLPIFLGGDHSIAIGTVGGVSHEQRTGVLWIDAHGDYNTPETSPSGNIHGMPVATLLGEGAPELVNIGREGAKVRPEDVIMIGIRDLDQKERQLLRASRIGVYTMREIDERGLANVAKEALQRLRHLDRLHISFDLDSIDPMYAPGVGTPVRGGLNFRETHLLMEIIADDGRVGSVDIVEVNPMLDQNNQTGQIAVDMVMSLLGKSIF